MNSQLAHSSGFICVILLLCINFIYNEGDIWLTALQIEHFKVHRLSH